jgi:alpha-tubulin suppressor-like RCC1 family protein
VPSAVDVQAGIDYVCFHLEDRTVSCMGGNRYGELGNGTTRSFGPLGQVHDLGPVEQISTELFHVCALKSSDEVWCWGQDYFIGRLGLGPTHDQPLPVRVPQLNGVNLRSLSVGRDSACVIADDGLWCWGQDKGNLSGRLSVAPVPIRIESLH